MSICDVLYIYINSFIETGMETPESQRNLRSNSRVNELDTNQILLQIPCKE